VGLSRAVVGGGASDTRCWAEAVASGLLAGDASPPAVMRIDKLERTLAGADIDVRVACTSHTDSGRLQDVVRFRSCGFQN
jgi:hypothetical protein